MMKKIEAYLDKFDALESLDNGGHFYNLKTKAEDGVISKAELGKVGGIFNDKQKMILFLEMSLLKLQQADKDHIISSLDSELKKVYSQFKPHYLSPAEAIIHGQLATNTIITGIPKMVESKSKFNGFIMFPITTGNITTFTMIPVIDQYDVYEIRDDISSKTFIIAHTRDKEKLPEKKIVIGGVLKEFSEDKEEKEDKQTFLEACYFVEH